MEVTALLAGGPSEPRKYTSLAQAQDDYLWYTHNGPRQVDPIGDVVGWAWIGQPGDRGTADWLLHRGPRGGLRWERRTGG